MVRLPKLAELKVIATLLLLFALVTYKYDLRTATAFIASCIAGWLNVFGIFHALLSAYRRIPISGMTLFVILVALAVDGLLGILGYAAALALVTSCLLFGDAVVLRFAGPPIGHSSKASEP